MTLRDRLQALFSPRRHWLGNSRAVLEPGGWFGPLEAVVPRARCSYRRLSFTSTSKDQRAAALTLAAVRASPEAGGGWAARWQDDVAHLWLFPAVDAASLDPSAVPVAESALVQVPEAPEADRILMLVDGVEGQVWRDGELRASRWWPEMPEGAEWARFLRSASVEVSDPTPPEPIRVALAARPWGTSAQRLAWAPAQIERAFWRGLALAVGLVAGWQLAATAAWAAADVWQTSRLDALRTQSAPLIDAREKAESAQARMSRLVALAEGSSDFQLVAEVMQRLPDGARLVGWLRDPGSLRVAVKTRETDPRVFVQAFNDHPLLGSLQVNTAERGADIELLFDMDVEPVEEGR